MKNIQGFKTESETFLKRSLLREKIKFLHIACVITSRGASKQLWITSFTFVQYNPNITLIPRASASAAYLWRGVGGFFPFLPNPGLAGQNIFVSIGINIAKMCLWCTLFMCSELIFFLDS